MTQLFERTRDLTGLGDRPSADAFLNMPAKANGPAAAAILAAAIGCFTLGLAVCLVAASSAVGMFLTFSKPVGPLSGKTDVAFGAFAVSWVILAYLWRGKNVSFGRVATISLILIGLAIVGTFPTFFDIFAG